MTMSTKPRRVQSACRATCRIDGRARGTLSVSGTGGPAAPDSECRVSGHVGVTGRTLRVTGPSFTPDSDVSCVFQGPQISAVSTTMDPIPSVRSLPKDSKRLPGLISRKSTGYIIPGGPYRTRTCDPLRVMQVRYQLRQRPVWHRPLPPGEIALKSRQERDSPNTSRMQSLEFDERDDCGWWAVQDSNL